MEWHLSLSASSRLNGELGFRWVCTVSIHSGDKLLAGACTSIPPNARLTRSAKAARAWFQRQFRPRLQFPTRAPAAFTDRVPRLMMRAVSTADASNPSYDF